MSISQFERIFEMEPAAVEEMVSRIRQADLGSMRLEEASRARPQSATDLG